MNNIFFWWKLIICTWRYILIAYCAATSVLDLYTWISEIIWLNCRKSLLEVTIANYPRQLNLMASLVATRLTDHNCFSQRYCATVEYKRKTLSNLEYLTQYSVNNFLYSFVFCRVFNCIQLVKIILLFTSSMYLC